MSRMISIAGVASGLACLAPLSALAQAAAAAVAPASAASAAAPVEIARVVITAQYRKEDIKEVPVAISVLNAEQLKAQQIGSVEDVTRNIPNISFSDTGGPGLGTVEIRGVSSQAGSATVSVYLDDVSLATRNLYSQGTAEPRFFDLDNVEVLRGPQGTLYGASSLGGTIKFISNQPDLKNFSGSTTETVSHTQRGGMNYEAQGVLNVPLSKNVAALRIGVERGHESGYIDQVDQNTGQVLAKDINSDNYTVVKMALKTDFGHGWSLTPALFSQETNTADTDATYLNNQSGASLPIFETSKTLREPGHDLLVVPSATLTGVTDLGTFTGVLSGYKRRFNRVQDSTVIDDVSTYLVVPNPTLQAELHALSTATDLHNKIDQTSLELRMTSKDYDPKGSNPFSWVAGFYLSDALTQVFDDEPMFGVDAVFANAGVNPGDPNQLSGGFPNDFPNDSSYYSYRHYHDKQVSGFGELTYHFTPKLAATVGLRELSASQHFTRQGGNYWNSADNSAVIDSSASATTPSFKVDWELDPSTSVYANATKGFRLGGANRPVPDNAAVEANLAKFNLVYSDIPASYKPDSVWSYELGSKSDFLRRTLTLNLSVFYLKWKNIQQDLNLSDAGFDFELNGGDATSYGMEAELKARVTQQLTLSASAGVTHATFSADQLAFGTNADGLANAPKGAMLPGVPKGSASLGADYHWAVGDAASAFLRGNEQWTGYSHGIVFASSADYSRKAYYTTDLSGGISLDKWEFTAFIKNANNDNTAIQHPNVQGIDEAYYLRPRTLGISGNYEF